MDARLVEFVEVLRQNDLRISSAELEDALKALSSVRMSQREEVKSALRSTLCKRLRDIAVFNDAFEFYFSGAARTYQALDASLEKELAERGLLEGDELKMVLATLHQLAGEMSPLAKSLLNGDVSQLAKLFRKASLQLNLGRQDDSSQKGFFERRLLSLAGGNGLKSELQSLQDELRRRGLSTQALEITAEKLARRLKGLEALARDELEQQRKLRNLRQQMTPPPLVNAWRLLSKEELEEARTAIRRLAVKLKSRLIQKQRHRRKGALNPRKTLRKNLSWGGIPMRPSFRLRRPHRPDVVVLCDVSESVRNASALLLLMMYLLQSLFVRVRSFVFVSELTEVTKQFKELPLEEALDKTLGGELVSLQGNSNYGRALGLFARDHASSISRRTTVMILGDGRNNFNPSQASGLFELKRRCRRLLWVCTEPKESWGVGDSDMLAYEQACHQVVGVENVDDLSRLADTLLPRP